MANIYLCIQPINKITVRIEVNNNLNIVMFTHMGWNKLTKKFVIFGKNLTHGKVGMTVIKDKSILNDKSIKINYKHKSLVYE